MPFDDAPHEGGGHGPGDPGHDPEKLLEVANASLMMLEINCDDNGLCNFHAGLVMQTLMVQSMVSTVRAYSGDKDVMVMLSQHINTLTMGIETLKEEQAKWQH